MQTEPSLNRVSAQTRPRHGNWQDFIRRRLAETLGAILILFSIVSFVALFSAHESDPSFSHATSAPTSNLIGVAGAYVADALFQSLGVASILLILTPLCWGWVLVRDRWLDRWWLRLALLPIALSLAAAALAVVQSSGAWPWKAGYGGFVGHLLLWGSEGQGGIVGLSRLLNLPPIAGAALFLPALALAVGALTLAFWVLAIPLKGYVLFGQRILGAGRWLAISMDKFVAFVFSLKAKIIRFIRTLTGMGAGADDFSVFTQPQFDAPSLAPKAWENPAPAPDPTFDQPAAIGAEEVAKEKPKGLLPMFLRRPTAIATATTNTVYERQRSTKPARREPSRQASLDFEEEERFDLPSINLLASPPPHGAVQRINEESLEKNARLLEAVLTDFGVKGEIVQVRPGPVVTLYELEPAPGTKTSRVVSLADDVARSMSAVSVRIAVVPGRSVIGIELPNRERETVLLRELLENDAYRQSAARLALTLGKDIGGQPVVVDLARMPHLLIAGTTGSGKSIAINTMIVSLLYRLTPDQCKFIMIDPKMLELSVYDGIPHLLAPVVTEPKKAVVALKWVVREMENRYRSMSRLGVRNIEGFNQRLEQARKAGEKLTRRVQTGFDPDTGQPIYEEEPFDLKSLPMIVVVVDEMADLMLVAGKDIEAAIQRLAQMARAAGIHIIMATQRPSVDVITGTIKANFPTRVSFHVTTKIDSRTILGETGAEHLLGQGDMLYMANGGRITRVHGPFISDREVEAIVQHLKAQGEPSYIQEVTIDEEPDAGEMDAGENSGAGGVDDLYDQAVRIVTRERKASTSFIQRHLQIGYNRAARIVERMEKEGVVSAANHVGKREVLARNIDSLE